jgi:sulfite reductase alpha subunit-like flavoprotein
LKDLPAPHGAINSEVILATMIGNERLTSPDHFQDTRKITLKLPCVRPKGGDTLMVNPANKASMVSTFLNQIQMSPLTSLLITTDNDSQNFASISPAIQFPQTPITATNLFTHWLNLSEPPSRNFCKMIGHFLAKDKTL